MTDPRGSAGGSGVSLVVGASRGIGLALVEAQLADASVRRTIATHRPGSDQAGLGRLAERFGERLQCVELDVTDDASLAAITTVLRAVDGGVDLAIHAAGLLHDGVLRPEKALDDCKPVNRRLLIQPGRPMQNGTSRASTASSVMNASTNTGSKRYRRPEPSLLLGDRTTTR